MLRFPVNLYCDVRIEDVAETAITFENGTLKQNKESATIGAFLRVYDGNRWYYCATTELADLQKELDSLAKMATPNPDILSDPVVRRFQVNQDEVIRFTQKDLRKVPNGDKLALVKSYLPLLEEKKEISISKVRYKDLYSLRSFQSSLGADIRYDYQHAGLGFSYSLVAGDSPFENMRSIYAQSFDGMRDRQEEFRTGIAEDLAYAKNAVPVEPGSYTCVLAPAVTGVFAHESFGHKSEADFMLGSETMQKEWAIGTKVGWEGLNIIDSGIPEGSGYLPYDDEGTKTTKTYLVRNGILCGRLHSASLTAAALNEEPTGNARALDFGFEPIVRMTSTYIGAGNETFEEMLRAAEGGIYIPDHKHGNGMSTFTIAPARAYRIRDGKIAEPLRVSVISGNVMETLYKIEGATAETELCSEVFGGCGKMDQIPLRIGYGGPYIRVRDISVQ